MKPFDDRETISAPSEVYPGTFAARSVVGWGLRVFGSREQVPVPVDAGAFVVGGDGEADLQLDDPYVSARHCVIERQDDGRLAVRDRRSKNGTWVNGNRVDCAELPVGALLSVGRSRLLVLGDPLRERQSALEQIKGEDPRLRAAVETTVRAGRGDCSVVITGETGTGKELIARLLHEASRRALRPFVALNCGAIPGELVGSELFGHEKGAFTGAVNERDGVFVQADGGTLFLDEIGELPAAQQPHLLRVLEERQVRRVGGSEIRSVDVRLVAATNRKSGLGSSSGALREDLYHRLATVIIDLPPLRDRPSDIPLLLSTFLDELAPIHGRRHVSRVTMAQLQRYPWYGNVRELRGAVARALTTGGAELEFEDFLPPANRFMRSEREESERHEQPRALGLDVATDSDTRLTRCDEVVRDLIVDALERYGSYRRAAKALGISKSTLGDRVKRYGILWPKRKRAAGV